jgi:exopolyphosphatase/guanosine-5'-triphosphate,3'-diphosphate pyrophosphatase
LVKRADALEIACGYDEEPDVAVSLPLGANRLTVEHLSGDPFDVGKIRELRRKIRIEIATVVPEVLRLGVVDHPVATSKTFRSLARICGAEPSTSGPFVPRVLKREVLNDWVPRLSAMTRAERGRLPGVSPSRANQLVAGALVAQSAMELLDLEVLEICPWALREGIILRRLDWMEG